MYLAPLIQKPWHKGGVLTRQGTHWNQQLTIIFARAYIPFLSILMSTMSGWVMPSLFFPNPSPSFQPIRWSSSLPIPLSTGRAFVNVS